MERFPVEDVQACVEDGELQKKGRHGGIEDREVLDRWLAPIRQQALDAGAPEKAAWVYFSSPRWTWENECGREGWLLVDPDDLSRQFHFEGTVLS